MLQSLISFDDRVTGWLYGGRVLPHVWENLLYSLASVFIYALPIILVVLFFRNYRDRLNSVKIFLAVVLTWQVITKYLGEYLYNNYAFRDRPFANFSSAKEFFFEQPQKAFPSDHSAVIMVVGLSLIMYKYPKLAWPFLILGMISSMARVVIGFHFFGDVIGGWLIGALVAGLFYLIDQKLDTLLKKIGLFKIWLVQKYAE